MQSYFHDMTQQNWNTAWIGHRDGGGNDKVIQLPMSNVNSNQRQPRIRGTLVPGYVLMTAIKNSLLSVVDFDKKEVIFKN